MGVGGGGGLEFIEGGGGGGGGVGRKSFSLIFRIFLPPTSSNA